VPLHLHLHLGWKVRLKSAIGSRTVRVCGPKTSNSDCRTFQPRPAPRILARFALHVPELHRPGTRPVTDACNPGTGLRCLCCGTQRPHA